MPEMTDGHLLSSSCEYYVLQNFYATLCVLRVGFILALDCGFRDYPPFLWL
jgi:hypothetical protein